MNQGVNIMSYNMTQHDTQFFMDKSNLESARQALRSAAADCKWFNTRNARSLENAAYQFGWDLEFDDDDNVNGIHHLLECAGEEERLFSAIAPYVKPGSYIQMTGEDGTLWRWAFDGVRCIKQKPTIIWQ